MFDLCLIILGGANLNGWTRLFLTGYPHFVAVFHVQIIEICVVGSNLLLM